MIKFVAAAAVAAVTIMQLVRARDGVTEEKLAEGFKPGDQPVLEPCLLNSRVPPRNKRTRIQEGRSPSLPGSLLGLEDGQPTTESQAQRSCASASKTPPLECGISMRCPQICKSDSRSPGRTRRKPLKPLRAGMPGDFRCDRCEYSCAVLLPQRTRGLCNGPRRVNPFCIVHSPEYFFCPGSARGPSPDGIMEERSANLRKSVITSRDASTTRVTA